MSTLEVLDDAEGVARRAVEWFLALSPGTVCLAGGETPERTYRLLAAQEYGWRECEVYLSDERCVPPDHPLSNWRMVWEALIRPAGAHGYRIRTEFPPEEAAELYERQVREGLPFDLAILGLGADGHTASLFPGHADLIPPGRLVATSWSKETGMWRVTMTLEALNQSNAVVFLVVGERKADALRRLLRGDPIPAALVRPKGEVVVLADREAERLVDGV